ncbi:MAG: hypothetical protein JXL97_02745 [Bacteroidales bacterium]|nr:hypothetical protein [Bacteroidales bacterium]
MKTFILLLTLLISTTIIQASTAESKQYLSTQETKTILNEKTSNIVPFSLFKNNSEQAAFWITLIIAAIGMFSIYGFAAGIIAVAVTYFATNGNKKAFKMSIWGCIIGMVLGALIRLGVLFL